MTKPPHLSGLGLLDSTRQTQRQRERASPRGDQRPPSPETHSCSLLKPWRVCLLHSRSAQVKGNTSEQIKVTPATMIPSFGTFFFLRLSLCVLSCLKSQSFIFSSRLHVKHDAPLPKPAAPPASPTFVHWSIIVLVAQTKYLRIIPDFYLFLTHPTSNTSANAIDSTCRT